MAGSPAEGEASARADRLEREVRERIAPTAAVLQKVDAARRSLVSEAEAAARAQGLPLRRALVAGSAARGTFLSDRLDLDLFLLFPPDLGRDALEKAGLAIGSALLARPIRRFAEHPYLRGEYQGFTVEAVPGYAVEDPSRPQSAVDRTPFHQEYLSARQTPELVSEVRLTKQFLRALGLYGSEAKTAGFSGYLVELLVLRFATLRGLLRAASLWRIPVTLAEGSRRPPNVPESVGLILDDPVDPHRNVASALSRRNLATFVLASRAYLRDPSPRFFTPTAPARVTPEQGRRWLERRTSELVALRLPRPTLVDDVLYPQLRKAERAVADEASRLGFSVLGSSSAAGAEWLWVLLETGARQLGAVRRQTGPPVGMDRVEEFLSKHPAGAAEVLQGPYVGEDGHLAVEVERPERDLGVLLRDGLPRMALGRDLRAIPREQVVVVALSDLPSSVEVEEALGELFAKRLPWVTG